MKTPYRRILLFAMDYILKANSEDLYDELRDFRQLLAEEENGESNIYPYVNDEMFSIINTLIEKVDSDPSLTEDELRDVVRRKRLTIIHNPNDAIQFLEKHENKIVLNADDEMGTNIQKILNHYC